jgi:hypothetical protein
MWKTLLLILKSLMLIIGLFLIALLSGCTHQTGNEAELLVKRSIDAHGGQKQYEELKAVSFKKTTRLFLEDGSLESEVIQKQSFQLKPDYRVQIEWMVQKAKHVIFYDGKNAVKTINGEVVKDSLELVKAQNAAKAAAYVFFQPFELINENTLLTLESDTELNDSTTAQTVSVAYEGDDESSDKWRYYFNEDDLLVANSVVLTDHNSLIENLEFQNIGGLTFNKYRKSYRVDKALNKKYLRAEYFYEDISITN